MEYMTVHEASKKWGLSVRSVQRLLASGRILGAKKHLRDWLIPAAAKKPGDPRLEKKGPQQKSLSAELDHVIEMTTRPIPLGNLDAMMASAAPGDHEEWFWLYVEGTLAYLRGDYEKVIRCYHDMDGRDAAKLRFSAMAIAAAISTGDYPLFLRVEAFCKSIIKADLGASWAALAEYNLAVAYSGAFAEAMIPGWLVHGDFSALPRPLRAEAICRQARYLHFLKKYESALDIASTALLFDETEHGASYTGIFLRIMCAASCCGLGRVSDAKNWLREAMRLALPHGFIVNFAELRTILGGLLEQLLEAEYPEHYDAVTGLSERIIPNWTIFHNRFTKDNITLILTPREYQMAYMATRSKR